MCLATDIFQVTMIQVGAGDCHDETRHFCCNDPRGRWRLLRSGGAGRRRAQDVHQPLRLYRNGLPTDLVRHHALRRDRRGLHLPDSRRAV